MRKIYFFYLALLLTAPLAHADLLLPTSTFEELVSWYSGRPGTSAMTTLVITQQDGRTGYAIGSIFGYDAKQNEFRGQHRMQFSDRPRDVTYSGLGYYYSQNFDRFNDDVADFKFKKIAANQYELQQNLLRWGVQVNVTLTKAPQAKLYTGWGSTIGQGAGLALYAFSLNGVYNSRNK